MAFGDTITFTINAVAKVLAKINQDGYTTEYLLRESGGTIYSANIRHTTYVNKSGVKTARHNVELIQTVPPVTPSTIPVEYKTYMVFELPWSDVSLSPQYQTVGVAGFFTLANVTKLVGYES